MAPVTRPKPTRPAAVPKPQTSASAQDTTSATDSAARKASAATKDSAVVKDSAPTTDAAPTKPAPMNAAPPRDTRPSASAALNRISRWVLLLVAVALGAGVGTLGSFGHRASATWLGASWPTGLVLCFGGLIGLLLGIGELLEAGAAGSWRPTRLAAVGWASAGWLLALLWLTYLGPPPSFAHKGDVILANDWKSMAYLLGGMVLVTVAVYRAWVAALSARLAGRTGAPGGVHPKG
jgi:hypothetical protein